MEDEQYLQELNYQRAINEFVDTLFIQIREYEQSLADAEMFDEEVFDMLDSIQDTIENTKYTKMKELKELKGDDSNKGSRIGFKKVKLEDKSYPITPDEIEEELHSHKYGGVAKITIDDEERLVRLGDIKIVEFDENIDKVDT
jgi:hypothetical protein